MIEFNNASKRYEDQQVLTDISFEIKEGEFFVLVGLSGSGKTTLLKMINQLVTPDTGDILIDGQPITQWNLRDLRLQIGYVMQQGALYPNLTVKENISLIPKMKGWTAEDIDQALENLMPKIGLDPEQYLSKYPDQLSGGEKQRVGILRAIITQPKIILMDEPFSALDPLIRRDLQELTKELHSELGISFVFVTHNMREAIMLADRIAIVQEGQLVQIDTPDNILKAPATDFVYRLFESEDLI
ncbi:ABC transporter ATP-binding protein [Aerococcaceae bacterium DSM 111020]|nr:ABC transporter ATP-binding protein [Aerococcaceae bacterium DSM 111020]